MYRLETETFMIELSLKVYEEDVKKQIPENSVLNVKIISDNFAGAAYMDVDIREFCVFAKELLDLYHSLSGCAGIKEVYSESFLEFNAVNGGHIRVNGYLDNKGHSGYTQKLFFENEFDQTYLKQFAKELFNAASVLYK